MEEPVAAVEEVPAEEDDEGEWEAHTDAEGRTYYSNSKSNETSWGEYDQSTWNRHEHEGAPYWYVLALCWFYSARQLVYGFQTATLAV